ncbi:hypothetical protein TeGR_g1945 [Tetraparma gracilis]|uniref:Peptidyl-prolyl cis-trans isomerase n=1 Tax=Tetraparma gracilis TaxID=2962635 RepID=A0ABQ6MD78_9STRA|nr:hypothetical protein TeGR_g1945 [Tetraparma gracilis]
MSATLHTSLGPIKVELFCDLVPRTSFNFLALAASSKYDGSIFQRVIPGFMAQGGAPAGSGGKGGESVWGGDFPDEFHPELSHDRRGLLSMANKGPGTNRSQFFLTFERAAHLNNVYTVFGKVLEGFEVLDAIERLPTGKKDRPAAPPVIERVEIHANPLAEEGIVYPTPDGGPQQS